MRLEKAIRKILNEKRILHENVAIAKLMKLGYTIKTNGKGDYIVK